MKKILSYLALSVFSLSLIIVTGCEDTGTGGDPGTGKIDPLLSLLSASDVVDGGLVDVEPSGTIFLQLDGTPGTDNLESLTFKENGSNMDINRISESGGNVGSAVALLTGGNEAGFTWDVTLTVPDVDGFYDYSIELTDVGGLTNTVTFTADVKVAGPANVYEVVAGSPDHTTLKALLDVTGLDATLSDATGSYTLFAPSDAAFGLLPAGTVQSLLDNPTAAQEYLTNHVVSGLYFSSDLTDQLGLTSLSGNDLTIANDGTTISVNGAVVEAADLQSGNGVVHSLSSIIPLPGTPIEMTLTGVLFNQANPASGTGSLDLDEGKGSGVTSDGDVPKEEAEIRDMGLDCSVDPEDMNWRKQIGGFNGTELRMVDLTQVDNFTFAGVANKEDIVNAFETGISGTQSDVISCTTGNVTATVDYTSDILSVGDMFVVRKNDTYYLVNVDEVNEDSGTTNTNTDSYTLSIKY